MECKSIKLSEYSLNRIREIGKAVGEPTDDTATRHLIAEYDRLNEENEKLKVQNKLLTKELKEVKTDKRKLLDFWENEHKNRLTIDELQAVYDIVVVEDHSSDSDEFIDLLESASKKLYSIIKMRKE